MSRSKHSKKNQPFITKYDRISQERLLNKSIVYGALGIFAAVILLILYGIIYINKIQPTQPIATVGGEVITTRAFQARVRFERQQLINIWLQNQQYMQMFGQSNDSFAEQFQNQMIQVESRLNSDTFGESILNQMIDEIVIRQKAQELGITVSAQEVEKSIAEDFFGFYANGTSTPEVSPTIRSTSTLSITQLSLVTLTPTATATMAGTSAAPTHAPTKTPSLTPEATLEHTQDPASNSDAAAAPSETPATPTATLGIPTAVPTVYTTQIYGENRLSGIEYYEQETGFSEADMWAMVESRLYRDKVMKFLEGESPVEEEQAWVRHIVVE
ncbi:MAG: SurA N-terminal domain-containing protein, partial [Anaerolineae bacterium]|nr:SurA N-terminal domain-containing protein [Anaerolineae bacterium]